MELVTSSGSGVPPRMKRMAWGSRQKAGELAVVVAVPGEKAESVSLGLALGVVSCVHLAPSSFPGVAYPEMSWPSDRIELKI